MLVAWGAFLRGVTVPTPRQASSPLVRGMNGARPLPIVLCRARTKLIVCMYADTLRSHCPVFCFAAADHPRWFISRTRAPLLSCACTCANAPSAWKSGRATRPPAAQVRTYVLGGTYTYVHVHARGTWWRTWCCSLQCSVVQYSLVDVNKNRKCYISSNGVCAKSPRTSTTKTSYSRRLWRWCAGAPQESTQVRIFT